MNTLKMKVLLILSNRYLHRAVGRALLIWFITCISGCLFLYFFSFLLLPPVESALLSLAFSSPALFIAIPFLYNLQAITTPFLRIAAGVGLILFTSACIIGFVALFFSLRYTEVAEVLLPFVPAALISFALITGKQIVSKTLY